jgi:hypothetical protein
MNRFMERSLSPIKSRNAILGYFTLTNAGTLKYVLFVPRNDRCEHLPQSDGPAEKVLIEEVADEGLQCLSVRLYSIRPRIAAKNLVQLIDIGK